MKSRTYYIITIINITYHYIPHIIMYTQLQISLTVP